MGSSYQSKRPTRGGTPQINVKQTTVSRGWVTLHMHRTVQNEPEDVDVGDLEVDHGAESDGAARDELGAVHHEVRVHQEHGAHAEVPRVLKESSTQWCTASGTWFGETPRQSQAKPVKQQHTRISPNHVPEAVSHYKG